jgi:hypothetical protein
MQKLAILFAVLTFTFIIVANRYGHADSTSQPAASPILVNRPHLRRANSSASPRSAANPNQAINDEFVKRLSETIAGRENEPAEKVFKNIPAIRFEEHAGQAVPQHNEFWL